jgi:hypothetical protein
MISLGSFDPSAKVALAAYKERVRTMTQISAGMAPEFASKLRDEGRWVDYTELPAGEPISVTAVQEFLSEAGFRPQVPANGICGYRTAAAIFLFQEYLRTVERDPTIGTPDGQLGGQTHKRIEAWTAAGKKADWTAGPSAEHGHWIGVLQTTRSRLAATPDTVQSMVNAAGRCATVKAADWDLDPAKAHLLGIRRRKSAGGVQKLDDAFKLLVHGQVFTFYGSTEPGTKEGNPKYPYLVPGQHRYRLGWHKQSDGVKIYQALKPMDNGVWVQRSAGVIATAAELQGPLDPTPNTSINVHWGGSGMKDSAEWSAGCQVIVGNSYANHHGQAIDCTPFAAGGYADLSPAKSKGAYTVLVNLVAALSQDDENTLRYTLLTEDDVAAAGEQFAVDTDALISQLRTT